MLLDGKKVACATCIKGHRATHCKHKDRVMVEIKKKGRPSTQCDRCRALRLVRQLHVKCNCGDESQQKRTRNTHDALLDRDRKKKMAIGNLRAIAPRRKDTMKTRQQADTLDQSLPDEHQKPLSCTPSSPTTTTTITTPPPAAQSSCCKSLPTNTIPSSSCCSSPTQPTSILSGTCCPSSTTQRNSMGQPIRLVTCRCGDSCTCIGCDAHPNRAMKMYHYDQTQQPLEDPYAGYSNLSPGRRGLSIEAICQTTSLSTPSSPSTTSTSSVVSSPHDLQHTSNNNDDRPTSVLAENGALLCGCGCSHARDQCTDCFQELCQDYFTSR